MLKRLAAKNILPEGHWLHGYNLTALDACRAWGVLPSRMGLCRAEDDLAYMVATVEAHATMAAVDDAIQAYEMKHDNERAARGPKK